jgi:hypothetical protein
LADPAQQQPRKINDFKREGLLLKQNKCSLCWFAMTKRVCGRK